MPRPRGRPATVQAPLTNRTFLTTSRSLGYRSTSVARERKAEAEGGEVRAKVSKQRKEKPGVKQDSAVRLRDGSKG